MRTFIFCALCAFAVPLRAQLINGSFEDSLGNPSAIGWTVLGKSCGQPNPALTAAMSPSRYALASRRRRAWIAWRSSSAMNIPSAGSGRR